MPAIHVVLGVILLLFGRRLYWLFVAIAGFLVGVQLADAVLADQVAWIRVAAAVGIGILGALVAMLAQRVAFALCGLYAGGFLALAIAQAAGGTDNQLVWFAVGGAIGAVIAALVMDWAIIVLSSLVGAGAIVGAIGVSPTISLLLFLVLAACGIAFQSHRRRINGHVAASP